jgi:hypothetical protein
MKWLRRVVAKQPPMDASEALTQAARLASRGHRAQALDAFIRVANSPEGQAMRLSDRMELLEHIAYEYRQADEPLAALSWYQRRLTRARRRGRRSSRNMTASCRWDQRAIPGPHQCDRLEPRDPTEKLVPEQTGGLLHPLPPRAK